MNAPVTVTMMFDTPAAAAEALIRLCGPKQTISVKLEPRAPDAAPPAPAPQVTDEEREAVATPEVAAPAAEKRGRGRPPKAAGTEPAAPAPKAAPVTQSEATPTASPAPVAAAPAVTMADAKAALIEVFNKLGIGKSQATLARFGVARLGEMKETQFADFAAYAKQVAAGAVDPEAAQA